MLGSGWENSHPSYYTYVYDKIRSLKHNPTSPTRWPTVALLDETNDWSNTPKYQTWNVLQKREKHTAVAPNYPVILNTTRSWNVCLFEKKFTFRTVHHVDGNKYTFVWVQLAWGTPSTRSCWHRRWGGCSNLPQASRQAFVDPKPGIRFKHYNLSIIQEILFGVPPVYTVVW